MEQESDGSQHAALDWSIQPVSQRGDSSQQEQEQVPIILRYGSQSIVTIKPRRLTELCDEAALEFQLQVNSFQLTLLIKHHYLKISHSLYHHIAPLSNIYLQLNQNNNNNYPYIINNNESLLIQSILNNNNHHNNHLNINHPTTSQSSSTHLISSPTTITSRILTPPNLTIPTPPNLTIPTPPNLTEPIGISPSISEPSTSTQPRKKFLINSLATSSTLPHRRNHQRHLIQNRFPFLSKKKNSSSIKLSSSSQSTPTQPPEEKIDPNNNNNNPKDKHPENSIHQSKNIHVIHQSPTMIDEPDQSCLSNIINDIEPSLINPIQQQQQQQQNQQNQQNQDQSFDLNLKLFNHLF